MEIKNITKAGILSAILTGSLLYGGLAIYENEIRNARMSLIEQREFTRNNPELCSVPEKFNPEWRADERCLTYEENLLLIREMNNVKQIKIDGGGTFEEIMDKKLLERAENF